MYRRQAEKQTRFLNSEFCKAEKKRVADAQEKAAEAARQQAKRQADEAEKKHAAAEADRRERQRQIDEANRQREEREAELRAQQAELQRRLDAEMKKPENRLHRAYVRLARLQFCRQTRDGYLVVYISEPELERAETATKAIERSALAENPDLDTDNIWKGALLMMPHGNGEWERAQHAIGIHQASGLWSAYDFSCKQELQALYRESPMGVYQYQKP